MFLLVGNISLFKLNFICFFYKNKGCNQSQGGFYKRMLAYFMEHKPPDSERSQIFKEGGSPYRNLSKRFVGIRKLLIEGMKVGKMWLTGFGVYLGFPLWLTAKHANMLTLRILSTVADRGCCQIV